MFCSLCDKCTLSPLHMLYRKGVHSYLRLKSPGSSGVALVMLLLEEDAIKGVLVLLGPSSVNSFRLVSTNLNLDCLDFGGVSLGSKEVVNFNFLAPILVAFYLLSWI